MHHDEFFCTFCSTTCATLVHVFNQMPTGPLRSAPQDIDGVENLPQKVIILKCKRKILVCLLCSSH